MTTRVRANSYVVTNHSFAWTAVLDDYDAPIDARHQPIGSSDPFSGDNTEFAAVLDLYDDWEMMTEIPLCVHRPMFKEDL